MLHPKLNGEEITRRGKELYEKSIRPQVETVENIDCWRDTSNTSVAVSKSWVIIVLD